jgi:hypothetical protein
VAIALRSKNQEGGFDEKTTARANKARAVVLVFAFFDSRKMTDIQIYSSLNSANWHD